MNDGETIVPELALLSSLNLRDASGNNFDPANYASFRNWILSPTATNMAYMLSAQLATMELNVGAGFVGGGALVYAGPSPGSSCLVPNAAGFTSVSALRSAADCQLAEDGDAPAGDPNRRCQEYLKTALENANNNKTFVQPGPGYCPFTYEERADDSFSAGGDSLPRPFCFTGSQ